MPLHHRRRALELLDGAAERQRVAAERDPHAERPLQLEQVGVIHAAEQQRIGAFGGELVR